jgi:hypothetical protein
MKLFINSFLLFLLTVGLSFSTVSAQGTHKCGNKATEIEKEHLLANKRALKTIGKKLVDNRYVPVQFHSVGSSTGGGHTPFKSILSALCTLNEHYDPHQVVFYLAGEPLQHNNDVAANNPSSAFQYLNNRKNDSAMNVFIVQSAGDGVAGYYTPGGDYIVVQQSDITSVSSTLTHEAGHFFSLAHPHRGWEDTPYNPAIHGETVTLLETGSSQSATVPVELVDRSNCEIAADFVCDTPVDYGFGQGISTCVNPYIVYDRNGDLIETDPENYMAYYFNCEDEHFTNDQVDIVHVDFDSNRRAYIRSSYEPDTMPTVDSIVLVTPEAGVGGLKVVDFFDFVEFTWEPVEHATGYILELSGSASLNYLTTETSFVVQDLEPNKVYNWQVIPFSEVGNCSEGGNRIFMTPSVSSTAVNDLDVVNSFSVIPNPTNGAGSITVDIESKEGVDGIFSLYDIAGRAVKTYNQQNIKSGIQQIKLDISDINDGVYILNFASQQGILTEKIIINK